jgi:hypothetical protein
VGDRLPVMGRVRCAGCAIAIVVALLSMQLGATAVGQARTLAVAALIGRSRAEVESGRTVAGPRSDGWVAYSDGVQYRRRDRVALAVRVEVAAGTDCVAAARALGFAPRAGSFPLRRRDGCEWPGTSERHRLGPGIAARLSGTTFLVWRR